MATRTLLEYIPPIITSLSAGFAAVAGGVSLIWLRLNESNKLCEAARRVTGWLQDRKPRDFASEDVSLWEQMPAQHREDLQNLSGGSRDKIEP